MSALSTRAERWTLRACSPSYEQHRENHSSQKATVSVKRVPRAARGSTDPSVGGPAAGVQAISMNSSSPATSGQVVATRSSSPSTGRVARTHRASGPPTIDHDVSEVRVNRARTTPYSGRGSRCTSAVTRPSRHRTRRSTEWRVVTASGRSGSNGATGIQSVTSSTPEAVSKQVASTLVAGRYERSTPTTASPGAMEKWPPSSSRTRPSTDGESKRGKQHQSMEPSRPTSPSEWQSPMTA